MIGKVLYLEFLFPISDYFSTLKFRELAFDIILPLILSTCAYSFFLKDSNINGLKDTIGYIVSLLAILIGFSITCITILSTNTSKNVEEMRETITGRKIAGKGVSLFQLIITTFVFALLIEFFALMLNLGYALLYKTSCADKYIEIYYAIDVFLFSHIFFLNIRNVTNFYFIFWSKRK